MKKIATIIMLIALMIVGYSVGNAIAKNHNSMNNSATEGTEGAYVVEEEYGVVAMPASSSTNMQSGTATSSDAIGSAVITIEEDVVESSD